MSPCDLSPILLYGVNSANGVNTANGANTASTQALFDGRGVICAFSSKPL